MKSKHQFLVLLLVILINSCSKNEPVQGNTALESFDKQQITAYISSKKIKGNKDLNASIDTILNSINWNNYKIVHNSKGEKLSLFELNSKASSKIFILLFSREGETVYYNLHLAALKRAPSSKTTEIDQVISEFRMEKSNFTGSVSYYKINQEFMYEFGYESGDRNLLRVIGGKNKKLINSQTTQPESLSTETCYDVYLITYWSDGSSSYDYLYSYCDSGGGGCDQQRILNYTTGATTTALRCGSNNGGSAGSGTPIYAVPLPDRQINWLVAQSNYNAWRIISTERFSGIQQSNGSKEFTGATHLGDNVFVSSSHLSATWVNQGVTMQINNVWVASCQISGKLTTQIINNGYVNPEDVVTDLHISKTKTWSVNEIW